MEKLIIKKKNEIACWKVDCEGICPNTVIETDPGITLLVNVEGQSKMSAKTSIVANSLINPGKNAKLFGGKKPYTSCEIFAVDISTEFKSEWGLAGPAAIPCYDAELEVDAKAVCFGEYFYNVDDFFSFVKALPLGDKTEISRDDVREFFRSQTTGLAKSFLMSKLAGRDIRECQARLADYSEDIKEELNKHFDSKGITIHSFIVSSLDFEPSHKVNREKLKEAKIGVKIKGVENEGRRDDISVDKAQSEIDIAMIRAEKGTDVYIENGHKCDSDCNHGKNSGKRVFCSRCGEANEGNVNYCFKCGEKLNK